MIQSRVVPSSKQKTVLTVLVGAIVAVTPAFLSFCQSRAELHEKYVTNHDETAAGYKALADSVTGLQKTALEQHDYVVKLEGQIVALTNVVISLRANGGGMRMTGDPPSAPLPTLDPPPDRPQLPAPPNFDAVHQ